MRTRRTVFNAFGFFYLLWSQIGCHHGEYFYDRQISGPYYLNATNVASQMAITYAGKDSLRVTRIKETVIAVGWNDNFITAIQHPPDQPSARNYYYIDRQADNDITSPSSVVQGPLSETEFLAIQKKLGLPPIKEEKFIPTN